MNLHKKAQGFVIFIVIIFLFIIVAGVITTVMIFNKDKIFKNEINESVIELFVSSVGSDSNYVLFQGDALPSQGKLKKDTYMPLSLNNESDIELTCWSDTHYTETVKKEFTFREKELNKSKIECTPQEIGGLDIELVKSNLQNDEGTITFELSTDKGNFKKLGVCVAWTVGFIEVFKEESAIQCDTGVWRNYTAFDAETDVFTYLPEGEYLCGKGQIEECESTDGRLCYPKQYEIPHRLLSTNDECFYYGTTVTPENNERVVVGFRSLANKNQLDKITFTFIDYDYRYDPISKKMKLVSEWNGKDIGAKDIKYEVKYNGGHGLV